MQVFRNASPLAGIFHGISWSVRCQDSRVAWDKTAGNLVDSAILTIV